MSQEWQGWQGRQWQGGTDWQGWQQGRQGWQQEAAWSGKGGGAGGYAPEDPDALQAAAAKKFAHRSRVEHVLFQTAASSSASHRLAAYGREELHPPEEYLAVNFPRGGVQIFGIQIWKELEQNAKNAGVEVSCRQRPNHHPEREGQSGATRVPRLVLLGPRGLSLEIALHTSCSLQNVSWEYGLFGSHAGTWQQLLGTNESVRRSTLRPQIRRARIRSPATTPAALPRRTKPAALTRLRRKSRKRKFAVFPLPRKIMPAALPRPRKRKQKLSGVMTMARNGQ